MGEEISIAGCEDEAAAELKWVLSDLAVPDTLSDRASSPPGVVPAQQMKDVRALEFDGLVGFPSRIHQQWEVDALLLSKGGCVAGVAHAHGDDAGSGGLDLLLCVANPRDVVTAEDSAVVAEKDHRRRTLSPDGAQSDKGSVGVRKLDVGQAGGVGLGWHTARLQQPPIKACVRGGRRLTLRHRAEAMGGEQ